MDGKLGDKLGIYISIPFCRSKCTYCNFASGVYPAADHARYVDRVIEDLAGARAWARKIGTGLPRHVDTVYLGGGTPSLLAPELLARLFAAMRAEFSFDSDAEITVECAPGQIAEAMPAAMAAAGVNRVSLGVQSFVDSEAHATGRMHDRLTVENDLRRLRAAGITNLNVDLIAGLPGQTFSSWQQSLDVLIQSGVPHASVYMLEVDEDSRLGRELLKGGARYRAGLVPGDDAIAHMYERAIEQLNAAGLQQYEISNFAQPGFESRHNLRYWQRQPYLGLGLDASSMLRSNPAHAAKIETPQDRGTQLYASSMLRDSGTALGRDLPGPPATGLRRRGGVSRAATAEKSAGALAPAHTLRSTTTDDLNKYLTATGTAETAWLSPERQHEEAWFLGLRLNGGVKISALQREFGSEMVEPALKTVKRLANDGLLTFDDERVWLTARGRLISNDVFQEFLIADAATAR